MSKILVTGSAGFIAGYLIDDLINCGYEVVGIDNYSKYGKIEKSYDNNSKYKFIFGDARKEELIYDTLKDCDHFIMCAALVGGISYFNSYQYDIIEHNEQLTISSINSAIKAFKRNKLKKITILSSSMVFEKATVFPTPEGHERECFPPHSTYGFQKLSTEFFAQGAFEQYGLPFTIVRPFNCIGIGEEKAISDKEVLSGNIKLAMSHVVPDLCQKILKKQDPLHILGDGKQIRHYTAGEDVSKGIIATLENKNALNNDFNISIAQSTTVLELAEKIWNMINKKSKFSYVCDIPFKDDVQKRIPDISKSKKLLDFEAKISLDESLVKIIPWIEKMIILDRI